MATLVFTALGTALGGPVGGAIGAFIGGQIDQALIGAGRREGPRLKELAVSTSSYGTPIPRHFGTMRAAGSIVWATELKESSETSGGGKSRPATTTYSYSASFAVALASRPILGLGRVWADGNLLRGAAGDLKVGGELRVYRGYGDQAPDPLIAADRGGTCPAFRGLAYCVFEALQLAEFGNRIPALTFEILAGDESVSLAELVEPTEEPVAVNRPLDDLTGFSDEGGPLSATLATLGEVYPLACDAGGDVLSLVAADALPAELPLLSPPAVDPDEGGFGGAAGHTRRRSADNGEIPAGVRYYDTARDYQVGLQRADGRARPGRLRVIEFPGALDAGEARRLANAAAERATATRETLAWRMAELDPTLAPGRVVRAPGRAGAWRIDTWEWRERGIELELSRLPRGPARETPADGGEALPSRDLVATPTELVAFEQPWDGIGSADTRQVYAAASSSSAGWTGAALYVEHNGGLAPLGVSGARRSVVGRLVAPLPGSAAVLLEREAAIEVELVSTDFALGSATLEALAQGANQVLLGSEMLQFASATRVDGPLWQLKGLLRGRGGTEGEAQGGHPADTPFVLLDGMSVAIDAVQLGAPGPAILAAIGLADLEPVTAPLLNPGLTLRPLAPVHPRIAHDSSSVTLAWARRARGAWLWLDAVDAPLGEQAERYRVGLGEVDTPAMVWETAEPRLELTAAAWAELATAHPGAPLWVRQIGTAALSPPLLLTHLEATP